MGKFVIECPRCGRYAEAKTGFFARKKIDCACGYTIDVRTDKLASRQCPHCGNMVVFDQSKGDKARCPVCREPINIAGNSNDGMVDFSCKRCGMRLRASKSAATYTCPLCDCVNDVPEQLKKEEVRKQGLASIIEYEGDGQSLIWKHPVENFNMGSQLIVQDSQEAIFFRDGQALDTFKGGRYTLEAQQLPVLEKLYKLPTDPEATFQSEVYFINKTVQTAIKWGTPDHVRFIDPLTGAPLSLGASGEMNMMVSDSRKLLLKLVGTMKGIAWDDHKDYARSLQSTFRPMIVQAVKSNLASVIKEKAIDILEIDAHLPEISDQLRTVIIPSFEEYGLTVPQFYITAVVLPDAEKDANFKKIRDLHAINLQTRYQTAKEQSEATIETARREAEMQRQTTQTEVLKREAERKIIAAQAEAQAQRLSGLTEAEIMRAKGYTGKDVLSAEVQKAYAEGLGQMGANGGGGALGDVAGLGVALGAMGGVMGFTKEAVSPMFTAPQQNQEDGWTCPTCRKGHISTPFCPQCGTAKPTEKAGWICPECGTKGITSHFCPNCGHKKPEETQGWTCPECGRQHITSNFCPECGHKKPVSDTWICPDCGEKDIKTNFCPNCGHKKGE